MVSEPVLVISYHNFESHAIRCFFRAMRNLSLQTYVRENKDRKKYLGYFVILIHFLGLKEFANNFFFLQVPFSDEILWN